MKRWIAALLCVTLLSACGGMPPEKEDPLAGWLAGAKLGAEETSEELYAAAQKEDMLVVYSTTTRMFDVAASFEKAYPGLLVQVEDMREDDIYEKLTENYAAGDFSCDVIVSSDGHGVLTNEFIPKTIAVKYVPYDIEDKLLPETNTNLLMFSGEATVVGYNETQYVSPPVNNLWELTEEQWRDMVYMPNPAKSATTMAFLSMIMKSSDMLAQSYKELYGEPLTIPEGENAGKVFIRKLVENDVMLVNSSDEVCEEIGYPGSAHKSIGIFSSGKLRMRDLGYEMVANYDLQPFCGVYSSISVMLAGGAKNVNTAKLFVRWLMGETDGQGEGYAPYLHGGAWSVRNDVSDDTNVDVASLNLLYLDRDYFYQEYDDITAFWKEMIESRK
jgi:iron(III) transport system substrate-binding protein